MLNRSHSPLIALIALIALTPSAAGQLQFTDITMESGVEYIQNQLDSPGMSIMSGGASAGDIDGDGWVDLFVTRCGRSSIMFRNLGINRAGEHLGFSRVTSRAFPQGPLQTRLNGASFGDVDGDGDLDLLATGLHTGQHFLWINDGEGHFYEEGVARGLVLAGARQQKGFSSAFGDFDRDGYLDLYVTEWGHLTDSNAPTPSNSRLLRNRGDAAPGYFTDVTDRAGVALESGTAQSADSSWTGVYSFTPRFADFNDDGWPDLAIVGDFGTSRLFWNQRDGSFLDGTTDSGVGGDENGMGATIADFDRDGNLDWFITSIYDPFDNCHRTSCSWGSTGNRLYLGQGNRSFDDATDSGVRNGGWGWGATEIDFDNDGWLDLAMTNGFEFGEGGTSEQLLQFEHDPTKLWRNRGGTFRDVGFSLGIQDRRAGKGIVKFDFDRDGDQDLFITNTGDRPILYRNDGGNELAWLQVDLRSSGTNSRGIGARVRLWPEEGDAPLVREQSASSNYLSQNETLIHFGLGADERVRRLEVSWPSGRKSVVENLSARRRIRIQEP